MGNVRSNNRERIQHKSAERRCLFRAEAFQEIVESTGKATKDRLKTADDAAAEDKAEETTPDALDKIRSALFWNIL